MDRRDPQLLGVRSGVQDDRVAVDRDDPFVGLMDAGETFDQRRLAGAVLAEQNVDLPGEEVE